MTAFSSIEAREGRFAESVQRACTLGEVRSAYAGHGDELQIAPAYGFYELDPGTGVPTECTARGAPESFLDQYEQYGRVDDPVLATAIAAAAPTDEMQAAAPVVWRNSGAYRVLAQSGYEHSLEAPVLVGTVTVGTLNFARSAVDKPFTEADLARAAWASRQIGNAMYRAARFEVADGQAHLMAQVVDSVDQAMVVSQLDGEQLYTNAAADRPAGSAQRPLAELAQPAVLRTLASMRDGSLDCASSVERFATRDRFDARLTVRSVLLDSGHDTVLSFVRLETAEAGSSLPGAAKLSPREQEIAAFIAQGRTTRQTARELFISENTVKQHLKRMFKKLSVHNRAQLIQSLWEPDGNVSDTGRP